MALAALPNYGNILADKNENFDDAVYCDNESPDDFMTDFAYADDPDNHAKNPKDDVDNDENVNPSKKEIPGKDIPVTGIYFGRLCLAKFVDVHVHSPVLEMTRGGYKYSTFAVTIQSNDPAFTLKYSMVRRRYSEFVWLRSMLKSNDLYETPMPNLPTRGIFSDRLCITFLEHRCWGLEMFLRQVVLKKAYRSDKALHLFLQTSLSTSEIQQNIDGERRDDVISCWKAEQAARGLSEDTPVPLFDTSDISSPVQNSWGSSIATSPRSESIPIEDGRRRVTFSEQVKYLVFDCNSPCSTIHC